jgi:hypothetical protein
VEGAARAAGLPQIDPSADSADLIVNSNAGGGAVRAGGGRGRAAGLCRFDQRPAAGGV